MVSRSQLRGEVSYGQSWSFDPALFTLRLNRRATPGQAFLVPGNFNWLWAESYLVLEQGMVGADILSVSASSHNFVVERVVSVLVQLILSAYISLSCTHSHQASQSRQCSAAIRNWQSSQEPLHTDVSTLWLVSLATWRIYTHPSALRPPTGNSNFLNLQLSSLALLHQLHPEDTDYNYEDFAKLCDLIRRMTSPCAHTTYIHDSWGLWDFLRPSDFPITVNDRETSRKNMGWIFLSVIYM